MLFLVQVGDLVALVKEVIGQTKTITVFALMVALLQ